MIIIDTSVWIAHLGDADERMAGLLDAEAVLMHPFVIGELAVGSLPDRRRLLGFLAELPQPEVASDAEVLAFIETRALHGRGIGYVDAHLVMSALLTGAALWTFDKRLAAVAAGLSVPPPATH